MKLIKLKPCPFCGGEASIKADAHTDYQDPTTFHVYAKCESCGASAPGVACEFRVKGDYMDVYNAAANQWNERAEQQPDPRLLEEFKLAIAKQISDELDIPVDVLLNLTK